MTTQEINIKFDIAIETIKSNPDDFLEHKIVQDVFKICEERSNRINGSTICMPLSVRDPNLIDLLPIEVKRDEMGYTFDWFDQGDMYSVPFLDAVIEGLKKIGGKAKDQNSFKQTALAFLQTDIEKCFDESDVTYPDYDDPEQCVLDYFSWLFRIIPERPRRVTYSDALQSKMPSLNADTIRFLKKFKTFFEKGESVNGFLSNNTKNAKGYDYLCYFWHVFHLHLCDEHNSVRKRSGIQLLAAVKLDEVLFIDVISHPGRGQSYKYFKLDHLRTIRDSGWLPKIGFGELSNAVLSGWKLEKDEDIYCLYKSHVNASFELDSRIYGSAFGVTSSGHPAEAVQALLSIKRNIRRYECLRAQCASVHLYQPEGALLQVVMAVILPDGNREMCDLLSGVKIDAK